MFEKSAPNEITEPPLEFSKIRSQFTEFLANMSELREALDASPSPVYGYGAAQIAPMLAYYLHTDFRELEAFLDEDERKIGLKFANLVPEIRSVTSAGELSDKVLLLTALDYAHVLIPKLNRLTVRSLIPNQSGT